MYTGRTVTEAMRKWQKDAIPHLSAVARAMGVDFELDNTRWKEDGDQAGRWRKTDSRDTIRFIDPATDRIMREIGNAVPVGEPEPKLVVVQNAGPNDYDAEVELSWNYGTSLSIQDSTSQTHGWSVTLTQGLEIGGESSGVKYIAGLALGSSGEYSKGRVEDNQTELGTGGSQKIQLPKGEIARLIQTVSITPVEIEVVDRAVIRLGWLIGDWKHYSNGNLEGHVGYRRMGHHTRWLWDCPDTDDFRTMMHGDNPRYPKSQGWSPYRWGNISPHYEWLMEEANRTMRVESVVKADQGVWGDAKIQKLDLEGNIVGEHAALVSH